MALSVKEIDGKTVKVMKKKLRARMALQVRIAKISGSAIAKTLGSITNGGDVSKLKEVSLGNIDIVKVAEPFIEGVTAKLSPEEFLELVDLLLVGVFIDDADPTNETIFDKYFEDDEKFLFKVLWFALEVNLGDFLSLMGTSSGSPKEQVEAKK